MDEPLSNLDAKLRARMRTEIARIQNDRSSPAPWARPVLEAMGPEYYAYFDLPESADLPPLDASAGDPDGETAPRRHATQLVARLSVDARRWRVGR